MRKAAILVMMRKSAVFEDEGSTREEHMVEEREQLEVNVIYLLLRLTDKYGILFSRDNI